MQLRNLIHNAKGFTPLALIAGVSLMALLPACKETNGEEPAKNKVETPAVPAVETVPLEKGMLSTNLAIPGELVAFQQVDLYAKENSFVKKLYADVGTEVRAGQLLATMEAPELTSL